MADDINFLQGIPIPQLGGGFAQQFTDFCNAVKNNFERLISIQYTKGNDGNSVEAKELIIDNSNEGDIVFDPCCGSGSHCLVAKENNRKYIGIELDDEWYRLASKRLEVN